MADFNRRTLLTGAAAMVASIAVQRGISPAVLTRQIVKNKNVADGALTLPTGFKLQWCAGTAGTNVRFKELFGLTFHTVVQPMFDDVPLLVDGLTNRGMDVVGPRGVEFYYMVIGSEPSFGDHMSELS